MIVTVKLFAGAKEIAETDSVAIELPSAATYADLQSALATFEPKLKPLLAAARFAADSCYVTPDDTIDPTVEIALIPPVSGG